MPKSPGLTGRRDLVMQEMLEQSAALFARKGFDATTLQDIAEAMGLSRPSLYHYVKSKDELLTALLDGVLTQPLAELRRIRRLDLAHDERVRLAVRTMTLEIGGKAARFRLLVANETSLPSSMEGAYDRARRSAFEELRGLIDDGIKAGVLRPVDPRVATFSLLGMTNWIAWWYDPNGSESLEAIANAIADLAVNALTRPEDRQAGGGLPGAIAVLREDIDHLARLVDDAS